VRKGLRLIGAFACVALAVGLVASPSLRAGAESAVRAAFGEPRADPAQPEPPRDVVARVVNGRVLLRWEGEREQDMAGWVVYRTSVPGHAYERVSPVLTRSAFTDSDFRPGAAYQYVVRAEGGGGGASPFSAPALLDPSPSVGEADDPLSIADAELPVRREWGGLSCVSLDRVRRVRSPRAQGAFAYEITVTDGDTPTTEDERCELTQGDSYRLPGTTIPRSSKKFQDGDERWIAFQVRVGDDWDADTPLFANFMQLKNDGSGRPPVKMAIDEGRIELSGIEDADQSSSDGVLLWSVPFTPDLRDRWLRFLLHVRFSPDPDTGEVALHGDLDGRGVRPLLRPTEVSTLKLDDDDDVIESHARIGIYRHRDVPGTTRVWFDGYTVAGSRAVAEAVAFAPPR
jgi:hypothetical protein